MKKYKLTYTFKNTGLVRHDEVECTKEDFEGVLSVVYSCMQNGTSGVIQLGTKFVATGEIQEFCWKESV